MGILALTADERVQDVDFTADSLCVSLKDGRVISVPLAWYPRLFKATRAQRRNWEIIGAGYGIHWPDIDEDLSTEGLLRGAPAPASAANLPITDLVNIFGKKARRPSKRRAPAARRRVARRA